MEEDAECKIRSLKVDGGASENELLMQIQADISEIEVLKPVVTETTALGAAYLAGLAVGFWKSKDEISKKWSISKCYKPNLQKEKIDILYNGWKKAINRSMGWSKN